MTSQIRKTVYINCNWKNVAGTADKTCKCESWKRHWTRHSRLIMPRYCAFNDCRQHPTLGAHVHQPDLNKTVWITPACESCNAIDPDEIITLKQYSTVVNANPSDTCARPNNKEYLL